MKKFLLGLVFLIAIAAIIPFAAFAHFLGYDSVDSSEIRWGSNYGITKWTAERDHAITKWNALGSINIAPDTASTLEDLSFVDVDRSDVTWSGAYLYWSWDCDMIRYNDHYFNDFTLNQRKDTALHELGHALGLEHHALADNVMRSGPYDYTELGSHDIADYNTLW